MTITHHFLNEVYIPSNFADPPKAWPKCARYGVKVISLHKVQKLNYHNAQYRETRCVKQYLYNIISSTSL